MSGRDDGRPDPDRLLAAVQADARRPSGRLRVWLGAAAGVGKTCAMLDAAHAARAAGKDVVVGVVEHHGRTETLARVRGLERLPPRAAPAGHRPAFDLDGALARAPEILLLDELAHSNAPGGRHPHRWQDVEELVAAGIEVWTTLNVQHLARSADVVARLTGVAVTETVPDAVLDAATEIVLVDLPPDALLRRLEEGKVYGPEATRRALKGFFRKGNLLALRALALRRAAARVGDDVDAYRDGQAIATVWTPRDRLVVAVGPGPGSPAVIRAAARLAVALDAEWHAVFVHPPELPETQVHAGHAHLSLAEALGARVATLTDDAVAPALTGYARAHNLRVLVLGASAGGGRWRRDPVLESVLSAAADLEVHIVPAEAGAPVVRVPAPGRRVRWWDGLAAVALVAAATGVGWVAQDRLPEADLLVLYLAAVVLAAFRLDRWASLSTAVAAVAAFNFFFTEPRFTFYVDDTRYLLTFVGLGGLGVLVSTLAHLARVRADSTARREAEARSLFHLGRTLSGAADRAEIAAAATRHTAEMFRVPAMVWERGPEGLRALGAGAPVFEAPAVLAAARWCLDHGAPAGPHTDTLPATPAHCVPLVHGSATVGVLAVEAGAANLDDPARRHLLRTVADQVALALGRELLSREVAETQRRADLEHTRSSLLAAVSHDLRTPLAAIAGAATTLVDGAGGQLSPAQLRLLREVTTEAFRLERLLQNLLQMTRLDAELHPALDWQVAQDVAGAARAAVQRAGGPPVHVSGPESPLLLHGDGELIELALVNLLENAVRHASEAPEPPLLAVEGDGARVRFSVLDRGPGFPPGQEEALFARFSRGPTRARGSGLGLAIVRAIAHLHGGAVSALARPGGGAQVRLELPVGGPTGAALPPLPEDQ